MYMYMYIYMYMYMYMYIYMYMYKRCKEINCFTVDDKIKAQCTKKTFFTYLLSSQHLVILDYQVSRCSLLFKSVYTDWHTQLVA